MDIVNPYFRTKDSAEKLGAAGIRLISSHFANSNVDVPSMPPETSAIFDNPNTYSVIDLGGDDRGAHALGRYTGRILESNDYSMLLVVNMYRPLSREVSALVEIKNEIETAAKLGFTGIINNSNLGRETRVSDVLASMNYAEEISRKSSLPIVATSVSKAVANELQAEGLHTSVNNIFIIDLEEYQWQKQQK